MNNSGGRKMNVFDEKLKNSGDYPLKSEDITTLQVNIGYKCNLACVHCHVEASPDRTEMMSLDTIYKILDVLKKNKEITTVDITGGSPELNPHFEYFVKSAAELGKNIIVRTNLAIYSDNGTGKIPKFLKDKKVKVVASLPCYTEEGVDKVRGKGTYKKAIEALKHFNELGYGKKGSGLEIDLMFNPDSAAIAPDQAMLEDAYRDKLKEMHGITFNHLIALSNMPIGRLKGSMTKEQTKEYLELLEQKFNPETVKNLMCRHLISVSPDGKLYDCDFWQMLNLPVRGSCTNIDCFDYESFSKRDVVTNVLCLMCTAGAGASCSGALTKEPDNSQCKLQTVKA
jgi:radical SAM/Cys-rich protein